MTGYVYGRLGAPLVIPADTTLPTNIDPNLAGITMQVAPTGAFNSIVTGAETVPITEPAGAQQIFRYRFIPSESVTIVDQSPTGLNGTVIDSYDANLIYDGLGQPLGSYGFKFYGINISGDRAHVAIPNNAKFGAARTRFIFGLRPYAVGDFTQTYLTILRAQNVDQSNIWSLVRGLDNSLLFGPGYPDASTALIIKNVFTDNVHCTIELEIDGQDVRIWKDNVLISDDYILPTQLSWASAILRLGQQGTSGGGPLWGHMSHIAAYTGDLSEGEIRWIRDTARTMIQTAPKILTAPVPPAPRPAGQLTVTRAPSFSSKSYSIQGTPVNFQNGRASDGLGGPIVQSFTLTLGGANVKPPRGRTAVPNAVGDLVLTDTFDNCIHPPQSGSVTLPIIQAYPRLDEAQIKSRLGGVGDVYIDNFDAGFPNDTVWRPEMVVDPGDGTVGFRLLPNNGPGRTNLGGSVQCPFISAGGSNTPGVAAQIYSVDCFMQLIDTRAPGLAKGYVQTAFTFTNPYTLPRREIDFEYNSQTGLMECTIHLAPNDAPNTSTTISLSFAPPASAFTGMRKWSILANADRVEWTYEDILIARYIRNTGYDSSVQNFVMYKNTTGGTAPFGPGDTHIHARDAGWHLNPMNFIIQQWMSSTLTGWIGANTVPLNHPLLRFGSAIAQEWGPANTALQAGDWTATAIGGGQVRVNVSNYRPLRFKPTHLEYEVGANNVWTRLGGTTGNQTISGLSAGSRNIRLRPVAESLATNPLVTASNFLMNANPSDTKTVTVT
jgi:hypothetical protein